MCEDFNLPLHHFGPRIVAAIRDRTAEFQDQVAPILQSGPDRYRGKFDPRGDTVAVFRRIREGNDTVRTSSDNADASRFLGVENSEGEEPEKDERPLTVDEATASFVTEVEEDLRILIKVTFYLLSDV